MNSGGGQNWNSSNKHNNKIKGGIYNDGDIKMENNYGSQTNTPSLPSSASAQTNTSIPHHNNPQNGYPQPNPPHQPPSQPPANFNQGAQWNTPSVYNPSAVQNGGYYNNNNNNMNPGGYSQNAALPPPPPQQQYHPMNAVPNNWSFYDQNKQQQPPNSRDKMYGIPISYGAQFAFNPYSLQSAMQYDNHGNEQKEGHPERANNSFQELHDILNSKWWINYNKEKEEKQKKLKEEIAAIKKELKDDEERLYNQQLAMFWGLPTPNNDENKNKKNNGYK